ncbi:MAG: DNA glycosylase [Lachnospira sp.]|nr:DNA glycosylase [Lachnospira sp.]
MSDYIVKGIRDFDLEQTLECGQCFHFVKLGDEEYGLTAYGKLLHIKQTGDELIFYNTSGEDFEKIWRKYFDLDRDYSSIKDKLLEKDDKLKDAIERMDGVRILNQDFFETLISFIISQNKQIPHIKKIVADISEKYGKYAGNINGVDFYTFPSVGELKKATVEDLLELKTGFRAPYIADAVDKVNDNIIKEDCLRELNVDDCCEELCRIKGVGNKVANCVMLFSLGKREAFPVDVWIKRIMENLYFDSQDTSKDVIAELAKEKFGDLGGYAQQYLFYYGKTIKLGVQKSRKSKKNINI